jgi:hypothetical protein
MKKISLFVAAIVALGMFTGTAEAQRVVFVQPAPVVLEAQAATPVVATARPVRAWRVPYTWAQTPIVVERRAPAYQILEESRPPVIVRGLFTDRVRIPRGTNLTIVPQ